MRKLFCVALLLAACKEKPPDPVIKSDPSPSQPSADPSPKARSADLPTPVVDNPPAGSGSGSAVATPTMVTRDGENAIQRRKAGGEPTVFPKQASYDKMQKRIDAAKAKQAAEAANKQNP